jgi:signal transduction histidine kinase
MTRLARTSIFRIAVLYLALLVATLTALTGILYWSTSRLIAAQTGEIVDAEIRGLAEQYRREGLGRLVEVIEARSGPGGTPESVYLLTDSRRRPLAGNLERWPEGAPDADGWLEIRLQRDSAASPGFHIVRGRSFELPGAYLLFVGRDTPERGDFRAIATRALAWTLIPALLLGLAGGLLIGGYSQRRVDAVRATGAEIMKGDLSRRVPLSGSGDEFDRLARTINEMLERIEALMGGMRLVTDSLSHDLRSPLTRALGGIEQALRKGREAEDYRQALEEAALNNIARAEAGVNRLSLAELDLAALAEDLVELYQPIAEDAGLALTGEIDGPAPIEGHRQLLGQAIANLLDNAVKYTPDGGRIALSVATANGRASLSVRDSGPGIPAADRARVLERFVRLDDSRGTPGSGLGLSLVAAVAKLHDARLELADAGPGLCVTLTFPNP